MSLYGIITARKRSLGQGNILSSVCQGLCPQGGSGPGGAWCREGVWSRGVPGRGGSRTTPKRGIWSRPTPKGEVEGDLAPP